MFVHFESALLVTKHSILANVHHKKIGIDRSIICCRHGIRTYVYVQEILAG